MAADEHHPLEREWSLYVLHEQVGPAFSDSYTKVGYPIRTIEQFWATIGHVPDVGTVVRDVVKLTGKRVSGYALFADGCLPEWEDAPNREGGEWCFRADFGPSIHRQWTEACALAIGETIECTGLRVLDKPQARSQRIEVWMGREHAPAAVLDAVRSFSTGALRTTPPRHVSHRSAPKSASPPLPRPTHPPLPPPPRKRRGGHHHHHHR